MNDIDLKIEELAVKLKATNEISRDYVDGPLFSVPVTMGARVVSVSAHLQYIGKSSQQEQVYTYVTDTGGYGMASIRDTPSSGTPMIHAINEMLFGVRSVIRKEAQCSVYTQHNVLFA